MTDVLTPNYTKEELDAAKEALSKMTPEDLLMLNTELELAKDAVTLPEAPAIAWMELRAPSGAKINLTARAGSGQLALDSLANAVAYARDRYGMATVGQPTSAAPLPVSAPVAEEQPPLPESDYTNTVTVSAPPPVTTYVTQGTQSNTVEIVVESIVRERKRDGKGDFLRVRGGKFTKFGVPCYQEKFPQGLDVSKMQYGLEYTQILENMKGATVQDEKPYHVITFHK